MVTAGAQSQELESWQLGLLSWTLQLYFYHPLVHSHSPPLGPAESRAETQPWLHREHPNLRLLQTLDPADLGAAICQSLVLWAGPESPLPVTDTQGQQALYGGH